MNGLVRTVICAVLILMCGATQAQLTELEGIWQDIDHPEYYFSLHINGDRVVLVDLGSLERTSTTLKSAYIGNIREYEPGKFDSYLKVLVEDMTEQKYAQIYLTPGTDLNIYWGCQPLHCVAGFFQRIRKIF